MISQQTIQQILSRIDIIDIIGGFVRLKKRGANYLGQCPFHNEKTPSFTVSPTKEIYKCFGCGKSGNTISFLMEHEKYSYVEALKWLANKYIIEVEETNVSPEAKLQQQSAESLYIINAFAQKYFSDILFNNEQGRDIGLAYLKERGFREDIIQKFQLGYCLQERDAFAQAALRAQYSMEYLLKSGLVTMRDERPADNYRGRIIFPVHNQSGKIAGFGARIIAKNDRAPKYINTPENELYVKSKILYGAYFARQAIDKNDECLLVEGYTDVVSLHQAGIENVVASGGTSLTHDQLRLIKKYTNNLTIIYDGDAAGIKAAMRGLDLALEEGLNVQLVLIPDGDDPDSYVNKIGASRFRDFIKENKKDFILFQLEVLMKDAGADTAKKSDIVNIIAEQISKIDRIEDFTKRQEYVRQSSQILNISEQGFNSLVNKLLRDRIVKSENASAARESNTFQALPDAAPATDLSDETFNLLFQDELQEKAVIRILMYYGNRVHDNNKTIAQVIFEEDFDDEIFFNKSIYALLCEYKNLYDSGLQPTINDFAYLDNSELVKVLIESTNYPYELSPRWNEDERNQVVNRRIFDLSYRDFMDEVLHNEDPDKVIYHHNIDDNYKVEADSVLIHLKLRKINRLIVKNEEDLKSGPGADVTNIVHTHLYLKNMQKELGANAGIIIFPF